MPARIKSKPSVITTILARSALHVWVLLLLANSSAYYLFRYVVSANCSGAWCTAPTGSLPGISEITELTVEQAGGLAPLFTGQWWVRVFGIAAYFAIAVAMLFGFHRKALASLTGRDTIIPVHKLIAILATVMVSLHLGLAHWLKDGSIFAVAGASFTPSFTTPEAASASLGLIALYGLVLTVISGILFPLLGERIHYRLWKLLHLTVLIALGSAVIHALRLAPEIRIPYLFVPFWAVFLYIIWQANLVIWQLFILPKPDAQVKSHSADHSFRKRYYVSQDNRQRRDNWYLLSDGLGTIWGYSKTALKLNDWNTVMCSFQDANHTPYIQIERVVG